MEPTARKEYAIEFGNGSFFTTTPPAYLSSYNSTRSDLYSTRTAIAGVYAILFVTGITGNGIILYTLLKSTSSVSRAFVVTDQYVFSLAASDFLLALNSAIAAIDMAMGGNWIFGGVLCKLFVSVGYLSLCAGVLIVMAMSIDRLESVVFAVRSRNVRTVKRAKTIIAAIWIFSFIYMIPATVFAGAWERSVSAENTTNCIMKFENIFTLDAKQVVVIHTVFRFVVAFLIPFVVMVCCNATIVHFLRKRGKKKLSEKANKSDSRKKDSEQRKGEKYVTRLTLLVTTVFLVCSFPNLILNALWVMGGAFELIDVHRGNSYKVFLWSSVCLLHLNSALNPLLYAYSGSAYRSRINEAIFSGFRQGSRRREDGLMKSQHTIEDMAIQDCNGDRVLRNQMVTVKYNGKTTCPLQDGEYDENIAP